MSTSMNAYHAAQAAVQQTEAQLEIARTNLGYCTVTAPISGIIKENGFKIGEVAELTDMLCSISDNSTVQAWFSYTESQLLELLDGYNLKPSDEGKAQEDLLRAQITDVQNNYEGIQAVINLYLALSGF